MSNKEVRFYSGNRDYTLQWILLWLRLQEWGQRCKVSVAQPIKIYSSRMTLCNTSRLPCNQPSTSSWRQAASRETLTGHISVCLFIYLNLQRMDLHGRFFLAHLFKMCFPDIWWSQIWLHIYFKFTCRCSRCFCGVAVKPAVCRIRDEHSGKDLWIRRGWIR